MRKSNSIRTESRTVKERKDELQLVWEKRGRVSQPFRISWSHHSNLARRVI
uniref:Uncharacterized protein n=1 Tax=Rhizophora mucronata TaxID=61149 RepID=A0A2P2MY66_RHIMU